MHTSKLTNTEISEVTIVVDEHEIVDNIDSRRYVTNFMMQLF